MPKKNSPEAIIKRAILDHCAAWHIDVWPVHTGGIPCRWFNDRPVWRKNEAVGMADIIGILDDGRFLAIEVKADKGRQSDEQRAFQTVIEDNGGLYILAHGPFEVREELVREGYL